MGPTIRDERHDGRVTFLVTAADSAGALLSTRSVLGPRFPRVPLHVHPHQTERFTVHRGRLRVVRAGRTHVLGRGQTLEVAPGVPHTFAVDGPGEVEVTVDFTPAGDMEGFLLAMARLAREGGLTDGGRPRLLGLADVARRHKHDVRLARVPARLQDVALALLRRPRVRAPRPAARPRPSAGCRATR
jgi:quercetin dioxygenase-like cupin family protein